MRTNGAYLSAVEALDEVKVGGVRNAAVHDEHFIVDNGPKW